MVSIWNGLLNKYRLLSRVVVVIAQCFFFCFFLYRLFYACNVIRIFFSCWKTLLICSRYTNRIASHSEVFKYFEEWRLFSSATNSTLSYKLLEEKKVTRKWQEMKEIETKKERNTFLKVYSNMDIDRYTIYLERAVNASTTLILPFQKYSMHFHCICQMCFFPFLLRNSFALCAFELSRALHLSQYDL